MMHTPFHRTLLSLLLTSMLAACASLQPADETVRSPASAAGSDLLLVSQLPPGGSKINYAQSLIIGAGENWMGRLVVELGQGTGSAYNYFLEQYPKQGWTLVSAVRGKTSLLVFSKPDRSATVEIVDGGVLGAGMATLTISPRNSTMPTPAAR